MNGTFLVGVAARKIMAWTGPNGGPMHPGGTAMEYFAAIDVSLGTAVERGGTTTAASG